MAAGLQRTVAITASEPSTPDTSIVNDGAPLQWGRPAWERLRGSAKLRMECYYERLLAPLGYSYFTMTCLQIGDGACEGGAAALVGIPCTKEVGGRLPMDIPL